MPQCEDVLISTQFVSAGLRIRYAVDAWVLHDPSLAIRKFNRRAFLYGVGFAASRSRDNSLDGVWLYKHLKGGKLHSIIRNSNSSGLNAYDQAPQKC